MVQEKGKLASFSPYYSSAMTFSRLWILFYIFIPLICLSFNSTCLKILATNHESSGGLAYVAGYDVSCERLAVFQNLGNCPQFDIIWPNLSVKNHLEFFARLKGLPRNELRDIAHSFAKAVGLGAPEVYTRNAGQLSGGMRRRLSIVSL